MKLKAHGVDRFVARPPDTVHAVLIFGPNEALVRAHAAALTRVALGENPDPLQITELAGGDLDGDPARLADEAASLSLMGGRRVVRVRAGADGMEAAVRTLIEGLDGGHLKPAAMTIIEAGALRTTHALVKLFEKSDHAAALPCYEDDAATLAALAEARVREAGGRIEPAALDRLIARAASDRALLMQEVEKLLLYTGIGLPDTDQQAITADDVAASLAEADEAGADRVAAAAANGDLAGVDRANALAAAGGVATIGRLRVVGQRLHRLHLAVSLIEGGETPKAAMAALRPPVFYKEQAAFQAQCRMWSRARLERALAAVFEAETQCKSTGMPDEAICGRALLAVARLARARG
jgi:DNA polymerase-3 subunit delta